MQAGSLRGRAAAHLEKRADEVAQRWISRVERMRDARALPKLTREQLLDRVPDLLASIAGDLRNEGEIPPEDVAADYLREHVELRRAQGYDLQEVLAEYEVLAETVGDEIDRFLDANPPSDSRAACQLHRVVYSDLNRVGRVAADSYLEAGARERKQLATQLGRFARTLEHEIRNPLSAAGTSAELLLREEIGGEPELRIRYAERIQEEVRRLQDLLTEVGRLSITEESLIEDEWGSLEEMVQTVIDTLDTMASWKEVELRVAPLPEAAWVSIPRVRLAIRNLVANAIKYADPGKEQRWVAIEAAWRDPGLRISVSDNGLGIPAEKREEIFQLGVRAHPGAGSGSGMGLTIVREILAQKQGSVRLESEEGVGSTFVLDLPFPLASPSPPAGVATAPG